MQKSTPGNARTTAMAQTPSNLADSSCPNCGYALTGLVGGVCPECGTGLTPALFAMAQRRTRRKRWLASLVIMAFIVYAPHGWVLVIDHPWNDQRWLWLLLWPVLPGLPATMLGRLMLNLRLPEWMEIVNMGLFTAGELLLLSWLGSRSRRWMIGIGLLALPPSIYLGIVSHALFQL